MKSIIVLLCGAELPSARAVDVSRSNTKDTKKCRQVQVKSSSSIKSSVKQVGPDSHLRFLHKEQDPVISPTCHLKATR